MNANQSQPQSPLLVAINQLLATNMSGPFTSVPWSDSGPALLEDQPNLGMQGPFQFSRDWIDWSVKEQRPGTYLLGRCVQLGRLEVLYAGRSDGNVNEELKRSLDRFNGRYTSFMFRYAPDFQSAFNVECVLFHKFGGTERLDNQRHPDRPNGHPQRCPVCGHVDW